MMVRWCAVSWGLLRVAAVLCCFACEALPQSELQQWQNLYDATLGDGWFRCAHTREDPCESACVTCDVNNSTIKAISMHGNNLQGTLPNLCDLGGLVSLDLSKNAISGSVPSTLFDSECVGNLVFVSLSRNNLLGTIPPFASQNLNHIDLGLNYLEGTIPSLAEVPNLQFLSVGFNELEGQLPELGVVSQLTHLDVSFNNLDGSIPAVFDALQSLVFFDVSFNNFFGQFVEPSSPHLNLTHLDLTGNKLMGTLPNPAMIPGISFLDFSFNNLTGTMPSLVHLTNLAYFGLTNNTITGTLPPFPPALPKLVYFDVSLNLFHGTLPTFAYMPNLTHLDVSSNKLTGTFPALWPFLPNLSNLYAFDNNFKGQIPEFIRLDHVTEFDFSGNSFTGTIPPFSNSQKVKYIELSGNRLTGTIPSLANCVNLAEFTAANNSLVGDIPSLPPNLQWFTVSNNSLSGALPQLPSKLQWFSAAKNRLSGTIPALANLTKLCVFDVSANRIAGTIPEISHLTTLGALALHENLLGGTLPTLPSSLFSTLPDWQAIGLVLVHNNFLSCALSQNTQPPMESFPHNLSTVLVAMGNEFSIPRHQTLPPKWLSPSEQEATLLFVHRPELHAALLAWTGGGVVGWSLLVLATVQILVWQHNHRYHRGSSPVLTLSNELLLDDVIDNQMPAAPLKLRHVVFQVMQRASPNEDAVVRLLWMLMRLVSVLFAFGCVALLPTFIVGAKLYTCGEPLLHTTLAYTAHTPSCEWTAAVMICLFALLSAVGVAWTIGRGRAHYHSCGVKLSKLPPQAWRNTFIHAAATSEMQPALEDSASHAPNPRQIAQQHQSPGKLSVLEILTRGARITVSAVLWAVAICFLSVPTVLYEVLDSLPHNNSIGLSSSTVSAIRTLAAPLLAIISSTVIPVLCSALTSLAMGNTASDNIARHSGNALEASERRRTKLYIRAVLASRLLLVIVLPVMTVLVFDNGCFQNWKQLWNPCHDGKQSFNTIVARWTLVVNIASKEQICGHNYSPQRCPRRVVEVVSSLILLKMLFQAFLVPAVMLVWHGCLRPYLLQRTPANLLKRNLVWRVLSPLGSDNFGLLVLTWVEVGLVFGGVCPLVLVALLMCMCTHMSLFRVLGLVQHGVSKNQLSNTGTWQTTQSSFVCPPLRYLVVGIGLQCLLTVWFFVATSLGGWVLVCCAIPLVLLWAVAHALFHVGDQWIALLTTKMH